MPLHASRSPLSKWRASSLSIFNRQSSIVNFPPRPNAAFHLSNRFFDSIHCSPFTVHYSE